MLRFIQNIFNNIEEENETSLIQNFLQWGGGEKQAEIKPENTTVQAAAYVSDDEDDEDENQIQQQNKSSPPKQKSFNTFLNEGRLIQENNEALYFAKVVYDFYFDKLGKNGILLEQAFNFNDLLQNLEFNIPSCDKMALITAEEQARKTFLCIPIALIYLALGFTPIYSVLDIAQKEQLLSRLSIYMKELSEYLKSLPSINLSLVERYDDILYEDSKRACDAEKLFNAISGVENRIIITIKHFKHLERVNKKINTAIMNRLNSKLVLLIDEAHKAGGYKTVKAPYISDKVQYDKELLKLKNNCLKYIPITATPSDPFYCDATLSIKNLVKIPTDNGYTGITNTVFNIIDTDVPKYKKGTPDNNRIFLSNGVFNTIENIINKPIIERESFKNGIITKDKHPHIIFMKVDRLLANMNKIFKQLSAFDKLTIINYTGKGINLFSENMKNDVVTINGMTGLKVDGEHFFCSRQSKSPSISDVFQFLAERGVEQHPYILVIVYDLGEEGISFISHYDKPQNWHLTSAILSLPSSITASDAKQTCARVFGYYYDNIIPTIYCNQKLKEQIVKTYYLTKDTIENLKSLDEHENVLQVLNNQEIFSNRLPTKYCAIPDVKIKTKINPNAEAEDKILKLDKPSKLGYKAVANSIYYVDDEDEDDKYIDGVELNKLKIWIKEDCDLLVGRMIQFLYKQVGQISLEEFRHAIDYRGSDNQFNSNILNGKSLKAQYGMLWICKSKTIQINPNIRIFLDKY